MKENNDTSKMGEIYKSKMHEFITLLFCSLPTFKTQLQNNKEHTSVSFNAFYCQHLLKTVGPEAHLKQKVNLVTIKSSL